MAATITTKQGNLVMGSERASVTDVVGDNSYPTGGYTIAPSSLGFASGIVHSVTTVKVPSAASVVNAHLFSATGKLVLYTATAEVANAVDVSGVTVQVTAWGN